MSDNIAGAEGNGGEGGDDDVDVDSAGIAGTGRAADAGAEGNANVNGNDEGGADDDSSMVDDDADGDDVDDDDDDDEEDGAAADFDTDLSILLAMATGGLRYPSRQDLENIHDSVEALVSDGDVVGGSRTNEPSSNDETSYVNANSSETSATDQPSPNTKSPTPPPASNEQEDLADVFLLCHKKWALYNRILEQIESTLMRCYSQYKPDRVHPSFRFALDCLAREERMDKNDEGYNLEELGRIAAGKPTEEDEEKMKQQPSKKEEASSSGLSLEELSTILFQPGMKFIGHIVIPGMNMDTDNDLADNNGRRESDNTEISDATNNDTSRPANNTGTDNAQPTSSSEMDENALASNGGDTYELIVGKQGKDVFGNQFILATHRAYRDEQAVHIQTKIRDSNDGSAKRWLEVEYADGETICNGKWNPYKFCFEGHVKQRLHVNDGIFHTDAVTHVFVLHPSTNCFPGGRGHLNDDECFDKLKNTYEIDEGISSTCSLLHSYFENDILCRDTRALAAHRHRTNVALVNCLKEYNGLLKNLNLSAHDIGILIRYYETGIESSAIRGLLNEKQRMFLKLRGIQWGDMFMEACIRGEKICAEFRRRASILQNLSFETCEDRHNHIDQWKALKMDLASAHKEWDAYTEMLQGVCTGAFVFASSSNEQLRIFSIRRRLSVSFQCFEGAYQSTSVRLPKSYLKQFCIEKPNNPSDLGDCIICQLSLSEEVTDDDDTEVGSSYIYQLPCSHCFHEHCVHQWLHNNSSCPICRLDLRKKGLS